MPGDHPADHLEIGRVDRAHGLGGEVIVTLTSNVTERLDPGSERFIDGRIHTMVRSQPHQHRWLVRLGGVDSRAAADALVSKTLYGEPIEDPDALWVHELVGLEVVDTTGVGRGVVESVLDNPAADILVLDTGHLVPLTFVTAVAGGQITVDVPEGLFDLGG